MILLIQDNIPYYGNAKIINNHSGLSLLCFSFIGIIITILHELGHYLSAVELQMPSKVKLNLRLFYLVVETDINSIWAVNRNKRYMCYLAGFYVENIILLITLFIKGFYCVGNLGNRICNAIILTIFFELCMAINDIFENRLLLYNIKLLKCVNASFFSNAVIEKY